MDHSGATLSLLCRVQTRLCALPLTQVLEVMRPLPINALSGVPDFVRGLSIIRGSPVPVLDAARLFGHEDRQPSRFVLLSAGGRRLALAVDAVLAVRALNSDFLSDLPPLLADARADVVSRIGALDSELLLVLHAARMLPEDMSTFGRPQGPHE